MSSNTKKQQQPKPAKGGEGKGGDKAGKQKGDKGSKQQKNKDAQQQQETKEERKPLQAVVLADSFLNPPRFRPFTAEQPKVLLPVVNIPMIEYTLEFLARGGVEDIIIFAASHADQIKSYISSTRWVRRAPELTVSVVVSEAATCVGDALRCLDEEGRIHGDFVLITGDVIANINLRAAIAAHKARLRVDTALVMTMIFTQASPKHPVRTLDDDLVIAVDSQTGELVHYENDICKPQLALPLRLFQRRGIRIRRDVIDSHICICSPMLVRSFADNFDYEDLRSDYVRQICSRDDSDVLNDDKIYAHIYEPGEGYASRIADIYTYGRVSRDVIMRWTFPLVPDNNFLGETTYQLERNGAYRETDAEVSKTAQVSRGSVIGGAGTVIGENTIIKDSVLGRNCKIGSNVVIINSFIWGDVEIQDGARIESAIVANGVRIGSNAVVQEGAMLSFNVVVSAGQVVPRYAAITAIPSVSEDEREAIAALEEAQADEEDPTRAWVKLRPDYDAPSTSSSLETPQSDEEDLPASSESTETPSLLPVTETMPIAVPTPALLKSPAKALVGAQGRGRRYVIPPHSTFGAYIAYLNTIAPTEGALRIRNRDPAPVRSYVVFGDDLDEQEAADTEIVSRPTKFLREMLETFLRGQQEDLRPEDVAIELGGLRYSHNADITAYTAAVVLAWFKLAGFPGPKLGPLAPEEGATPEDASAPFKVNMQAVRALNAVVDEWGVALSKYARNEQDQIKYILPGVVRACCMNPDAYVPAMSSLFTALYNSDIVTREAILAYYPAAIESLSQQAAEENRFESLTVELVGPVMPPAEELKYVKRLATLITALEEVDEDEDEDEDEEEDDA